MVAVLHRFRDRRGGRTGRTGDPHLTQGMEAVEPQTCLRVCHLKKGFLTKPTGLRSCPEVVYRRDVYLETSLAALPGRFRPLAWLSFQLSLSCQGFGFGECGLGYGSGLLREPGSGPRTVSCFLFLDI